MPHFTPESTAMAQQVTRLENMAEAAKRRNQHALAAAFEEAAFVIECRIPQQKHGEASAADLEKIKAKVGYTIGVNG